MANRTGFPVTQWPDAETAKYALYFNSGVLTLRDNTAKPPVDIAIDFSTGHHRHRRQFGGGLGQPLARAVNAGKLQNTDEVIGDATGGLGRDAFVFASLGCQVILLERSKVVYELLCDAIARAKQHPLTARTASLMQVYRADSTHLPANWPVHNRPNTIYLDPMYPKSGKTAAAKKEMQTLKRLLGVTDNNQCNDAQLLEAALQTASRRVVVKRPKSAAHIPGPKPVGEIKSANTRYDIYHPHNN